MKPADSPPSAGTDSAIVRRVEEALARVRNPNTGRDVVAGGQIGELTVDSGGNATFRFALHKGDPGVLVRQARAAAQGVEGVQRVKVDVQLPQSAQAGKSGATGAANPGRAARGGLQPGSVPAPTPNPGVLAGVKRVIAVSSGKGGVGKSMVATNLAALAAARGLVTGLLDADIYGPNIPIMFGEGRRPAVTGAKGSEMIVPLEAHGVRLMSLGFLLEREQPAIMRGPLIAGILKQFMEQVEWGAMDLMIVDMPPGTGDAQLSLVQTVELDGAVMVTTPQRVATGDVRRGVRMFERVNTRILGVVENMCGFQLPGTDEVVDLFGRGGGEELARELELPFLGRVPLDIEVRRSGDQGRPTVLSAPQSLAGQALTGIGERLLQELEELPPR